MPRTAVYRHFDAAGQLLYVGMSLSALKRLAEHERNSAWADQIVTTTHQRFKSRRAAHEAEVAAIHAEAPVHNVIRYDGQRQPVKKSRRRLPIRIAYTFDPVDAAFEAQLLRMSSALPQPQLRTLEQLADLLQIEPWQAKQLMADNRMVGCPIDRGVVVMTTHYRARGFTLFA